LDKKFSGAITRTEENRLSYVRWSLDRVDDAKYGQDLEVLESAVERYERLHADMRDLQAQLAGYLPRGKTEMSRVPSRPANRTVPAGRDQRLIARSQVEPGKKYPEYREELRYDFFHSCAYCTMSEFEAQSIRMTIDHYEPRKARPDLTNEYGNLMYACSVCNERKSDRYPPQEARDNGQRFFRPDEDVRADHFTRTAIFLEPVTEVGNFSIQTLDLNRRGLLKLRELRKRLADCDPLVSEGILALRSFHIDQLPREVKVVPQP